MVVVGHASKILMGKRGERRRDRIMILEFFVKITEREVVERIRLWLRVEASYGMF
jgi:hypothetical protein